MVLSKTLRKTVRPFRISHPEERGLAECAEGLAWTNGGWRINHCDNNRSKGSKGRKGAGREGSSCHIDFKVGANCKGLSGLVKLIVYSC